MSKKLARVYILSLIGLFGLVTSAFSVPLLGNTVSYTTDPVNIPGDQSPFAGIEFSLSVTESINNPDFPYTATFTITPGSPPAGAPNWYIGWFVLQFDAGTPAVIDPAITYPGGIGEWKVLDSSTALPWHGDSISPANAGKSGLYLFDMPDSQTEPWTVGVPVYTGGPYTFVFNFQETSDLAETVNFQVGFYSDVWQSTGGAGVPDVSQDPGFYKATQLSSTLVPEPSTLLLLGAGLIAFGILGRRKFRS